MTLNYDLTAEDLVAYQLHFAKNVGQLKRSKFVLAALGAMMMVFGLLLWTLGRAGSVGGAALGYGLFLLCFGLLLPKSMENNLRKTVKKGYYKALLGQTQVTLSPKGIQSLNGMSESTFFWGAVEQVAETPTHLFVQFSAGVNLVIPKRAFATQTHGEQFLKQVEEYRQAATGSPIPTTQRGAWWTQGSQVVETQQQRH